MKITLLPKTKLGNWSFVLMVSGWLLFVVGSVLPWKPGTSGFEFIAQNPLQSIITIIIMAAGVATVGTGLAAVIKNQERSILVFLAILSGLYSILGFVGSIVNLFFS